MKKFIVLIAMLVVLFIGIVMGSAAAGIGAPDMGHIESWSSAGTCTEYDYIVVDGEWILFNETEIYWK